MLNRGKYLFVVVAMLLVATGVFAQAGSIHGTVVDQKDQPLPGVTVEASSPVLAQARVAVTDVDGKFTLDALPAGTYNVKCSLSGFTTITQTGIKVETMAVTLQVKLPNAFKEEVTVTGTLIPRPTLEALSPVATMDVEELAYQGTTRLEDMLTSLPQVFHAQNSTISNGATGTATIDLRYMGDRRTLVLVDGRRLPAGDPGDVSPDLNFIPAPLIKRVDVLTGGASATYGADAVAGVVNFILDKDFEGFKGGILGGEFQHDNSNSTAAMINQDAGFKYPHGSAWDGGQVEAYAAYGSNFADGKGHATMYIDYRNVAADLKARRDYLNCSVLGLDPSGPYCGGSSTIPNGRFRVYNPNTLARLGDYMVDASTGNTLIPFSPPYFNYAPYNFMQRPDERWAAGGFLDYKWNQHAHGYMEVMLMRDQSDAQIAPSGSFGSVFLNVNCDNPMLSDQERSLLCVMPDANNNALLLINKRGVEGGGRDDNLIHESFRLVAGVKGEINKQWNYDVYGLDAQTLVPETYNHDYSYSKIQDALLVQGTQGQPSTWSCISGNTGCAPWNIFTLGGVTQAALNYVQIPLLSNAELKTQVVSAKLLGDLRDYGIAFPSATEGVSVAIGAEYRTEYLNYQPDQSYIDSLGAGQGGPSYPTRGSYRVKEGFVEGNIPIVQNRPGAQNLTLELGYRYSDYNVNGGYSTWKTQAAWAPINDVKFRVGFNRATRAPNISELFAPTRVVIGDLTSDPCAGPNPSYSAAQCAYTGMTAAQYGNVDPNPANQYNGKFGGNDQLKPEIADTKTFGIVLTPTAVPGLNLTLDYYDIKLKDVITGLPPNSVMTQCLDTGDPTLCAMIHRDAVGSLWILSTGYVSEQSGNYGEFHVKGIDANATYAIPVGQGMINLNLVGSYMDSWVNKNPFVNYDCAGYFGNTCGDPSPKWRHIFRATWDTGNVSASLAWRYVGPVTVDEANHSPSLYVPEDIPLWKAVGSYHYSAYNYFDLALTYKFSRAIQFMIGCNNIADKEPPLGVGFSGNDYGPGFHGTYDPYGRYIHSSLTFNF
jgi:iron complex outermembrane receptor protein